MVNGGNMPNKFSDYVNKDNNYKYTNTQNINTDQLQSVIDTYAGKSSNELMQEFIRLSNIKKANGTLNAQNIENIKNTIFPYLTEEQKQTFYKIMEGIK